MTTYGPGSMNSLSTEQQEAWSALEQLFKAFDLPCPKCGMENMDRHTLSRNLLQPPDSITRWVFTCTRRKL